MPGIGKLKTKGCGCDECACVFGLTLPADPTTATIRVTGSNWVNGAPLCEVERWNGTNDLAYAATESLFGCTLYRYEKAVFTAVFTQMKVWVGTHHWPSYFVDGCGKCADNGVALQLEHAPLRQWAFEDDGAGNWTQCDFRDADASTNCDGMTDGDIDSVVYL